MDRNLRITVLLGGVSAERDVSLSSGLRIAIGLRERGHEVTCLDPAMVGTGTGTGTGFGAETEAGTEAGSAAAAGTMGALYGARDAQSGVVNGVLSRETEARLLAQGVGSVPPSLEALAGMRAQSLSPRLAMMPEVTQADCVFLALHGGQGEDGTVQALLDMVGVPYTGSGHLASALAMDKHLSKVVLRAAGVATANWLMVPSDWEKTLDAEEVGRHLDWPVVVKPSKQGSTVGLSVVRASGELAPAIREAFKFDDEVMIERFVPGQEVTVGILGNQVLPTIEIQPVKELYDYECKYTPGMAKEFVADLPAEIEEKLADQALRAYGALKLGGVARIDFRLDPHGQPWCLEANTLPGMTPTSLIPQAAAAAGVLFPELCERIVQLALNASRFS